MREVSACDFCGGGAAGTFEVLPPSVDGGRRMVLCDGCRDTLATVLDPLLDARNGDTPDGAAGETDRAAEPADDAATGDDASGDDGDAESVAPAGSGPSADDKSDGASSDDDMSDGASSDDDMSDGASSAEDDDPAAGAAAGERPPRGYRKVVRFLQNRSFPLDRAEAVSMVSDAYGLEQSAVEAAVDHAVAEGRFSESDGQLRA